MNNSYINGNEHLCDVFFFPNLTKINFSGSDYHVQVFGSPTSPLTAINTSSLLYIAGYDGYSAELLCGS